MCEHSIDSFAVERMNERYVELAAMLKEVGCGSIRVLNKILAKFSLQEGIRRRKAKEYIVTMVESGIVKYTNGHKSWRYDAKEEWELFKVEI